LFTDLNKCDDTDTNNNDGITNFDLTVNGSLLIATQPLAPSNYTITYHININDAQSGNAPIINPSNYINTAFPNTQTIWVSIKHNATGCRNWGSFQINVGKPLVLTARPVFTKCDDDLMQPPRVAFDLTSQNTLILAGAP
jgi:valyl-tRNA synthetase